MFPQKLLYFFCIAYVHYLSRKGRGKLLAYILLYVCRPVIYHKKLGGIGGKIRNSTYIYPVFQFAKDFVYLGYSYYAFLSCHMPDVIILFQE